LFHSSEVVSRKGTGEVMPERGVSASRAVFVGDSVWDAKSGFAHAPFSE
jgi:hypothetical protein